MRLVWSIQRSTECDRLVLAITKALILRADFGIMSMSWASKGLALKLGPDIVDVIHIDSGS